MRTAVVGCLLVLLATACGSGAEQSAPATPLVGVILPDNSPTARWESQDRPMLEQAFEFAGIEPVIENAEGDEAKFSAIADRMIEKKVKVLMITPLTTEGGANIERKAKSAGITVINYDRISLGGQADYYVSFDNLNIGELQAEGLLGCLGTKRNAQIIEIQGSPTDNSATLIADGQRRRLGPLYDDGTLKLVRSQAIEKWDAGLGSTSFEQILDANNGKVDGVVAANDDLAGGVIDVLRERGLAKKVAVTGQDATLPGLRALLLGEQCVTIYKPIRDEANAAARLAITLAKGDVTGADDLATGNTRDLVARRDVKSVLLGADLITRDNVRQLVVTENVVKPAELCAGEVAPICEQMGILVN
ncbi:D-xylose transport system substrate-binding protein [Saccharothrix violaceirubra]|uniref:D-xylose transport system substrate-binding protein n=2 Tax=Saccharothrix violaceirubra TaxID=413306 RepID=A0A7W7T7R2_9PSEU|nr:substrate-binding domain-containing protein [Saccharothrix violaceirubra]MBB4968091.1 D-xylose transport system substrate-binding protein [Saccharothrix violaceirubra]